MTRRKRRNHSPGFKAKVAELHEKIGELAMERDFLAKALGRDR